MRPEVPTVTVEEAARMLERGVRLIDVREQNEWDESHVPGTELRPMSTINDWYTELDPAEEIIVLCRSGNRSGSVVNALIQQVGFEDISNIAGGILAWAEADLPVEPPAP